MSQSGKPPVLGHMYEGVMFFLRCVGEYVKTHVVHPNVTGQKYSAAVKISEAEILGMLRSCVVLLPLRSGHMSPATDMGLRDINFVLCLYPLSLRTLFLRRNQTSNRKAARARER